jgi:hypothetical protein
MIAGQIEIQLMANLARLQNDMDKAQRTVGGAMSSIDKAVGVANKAFGALGVGIGAISFAGLVKQAIGFADKINDVAKANDVAVESVLRLSQALSLNGGEASAAGKIFAAFTASIDDAATGTEKTQARFKQLGITLQDLRTLDGQALFAKTLASLKDVEDPIRRNAMAMDLLGKAVKGVDISGLGNDFADNNADFTDAEKSFKEIGVAMDKLDILTTKASRTLAEVFAPALTTSVNLLDRFVFGYAKLEQNIKAANKAAGEKAGISPFKAAPTIKDKPGVGQFSLGDYAKAAEVREVVDKEEENRRAAASRKAAQDAKDRVKAEKEALEKLADEREKYSAQERKDWLETQIQERKVQLENEKDIYEAKLKNIDLLQKAAQERYEEEQRLQEDLAREQKRANDEFSRSLTDALFRGFEKGKSFLQNFKTTLINAFQTLILRPRIEAVIGASGIGGLFSGNANAGGGLINNIVGGGSASGGGFGGYISDLKSVFSNGNASLVGAIESFGSTISNGLGGFRDTVGGFVGQNAGLISSIAPYSGAILSLLKGDVKGAAFQGAGVAIGSVFGGPIGGAIGGLLGGVVGGLFGGKKQPPRTITQLGDVNEQFSGTLGGVLKTFGGAGNVSTNARYAGRDGGSGYGFLDANFDGQQINFAKRFKDAYGEASLKEFIEKDVFAVIKQAIQRSSIDANFKGVYGRTQSMGEINSVTQAAQSLKANNAQLIKIYGTSSEAVAWHTNVMGLSTEQFLQYTNAVINAANSTKSIGQALIEFKTSLSNVYGGTIPATIEQFDAKMKSLAGNPQGFANLLGIRDQFVQFTQSINGLKGNVRGALFGIVSDSEKQAMMNADLAKMFSDLNRDVPGSIQELIALGKSIDYTTAEGLNLAAVFPTLVNAFNQTKGAVDGLINSLRGVNNFKTLVDFQRYQGVANNYGASFANNYVDNLPSYDVGTSFVPNDGPAMIHQGERILTASENRDLSSMNAAMVSELRSLRTEMAQMRRDSSETARSTKKTSDLLTKVTEDGTYILTREV